MFKFRFLKLSGMNDQVNEYKGFLEPSPDRGPRYSRWDQLELEVAIVLGGRVGDGVVAFRSILELHRTRYNLLELGARVLELDYGCLPVFVGVLGNETVLQDVELVGRPSLQK